MKTIKFYLCLAFIVLSTSFGNALENAEFLTVMGNTLAKVDSAQNVNELRRCRNQFERIAQKYRDHWLPVYYIVYCDLQMIYYPGEADKKQLADDAKSFLEKLDKMSEADQSEVHTLWGYYYSALVMVDPQNGQKYYQKVIDSYEKAITLNPENPRPVCLLAFYKQYLPSFLRSDKDIEEGKQKAKELFEKEERTIEKPYWGLNFLDWIKTNNN